LVCDTGSGVDLGLPEHVNLKTQGRAWPVAMIGMVLSQKKCFLKLKVMCMIVHSGAFLVGNVTSSENARNCGPVE